MFIENTTKVRQATGQLQKLVQQMASDGINTHEKFLSWRKNQEKFLAEIFGYESKGKMPPIGNLFNAFFHPRLPLVGLNYTPGAQSALRGIPWPEPLRWCRGIILNRRPDFAGRIVALPYRKAFFFGEYPETLFDPSWPRQTTIKEDGYLGIIFEFNGEIEITTRGDFESQGTLIGQELLKLYKEKKDWARFYPPEITTLVEIIHPATKVHLDYSGEQRLILTGAFDRRRLNNYDHRALEALGVLLGLPISTLARDRTPQELATHIADRTIENREGYVMRAVTPDNEVCFTKFKFETYIGLMAKSSLSLPRLMEWMIRGDLPKKMNVLPEEIVPLAEQMLGQIQMACWQRPDSAENNQKKIYERLYALQTLDHHPLSPSYFQKICREFVRQQFAHLPKK